jgi:hypothetical protein
MGIRLKDAGFEGFEILAYLEHCVAFPRLEEDERTPPTVRDFG